MLFEYKSNINYRLRSILTSNFFSRELQQYDACNLFFVVKNKSRNQVVFLLIILSLVLSITPKLIFKKRLSRKPVFLGFRVFLKSFVLMEFIFLYISILDTITIAPKKFNKGETNVLFSDFPIVYEVDRLCEQYNSLIEFIKSFRFILNYKMISNSIYIWYFVESLLRLFKVPILNSDRFIVDSI